MNQQLLEIYQQTAVLAKTGVWEVNLQTGEVFWDNATFLLFEADLSTPLNQASLLSFVTNNKDKEQLDDLFNQLKRTGNSFVYQFSITTAKQNSKQIEIVAQAHFQYGKCIKINGIFKDITETVGLIQSRLLHEEKLNSIFQNAPIGMAVIDDTLCWSEINYCLSQFTGFSANTLIGKPFFRLFHPSDWQKQATHFHSFVKGNQPKFEAELRCINAEEQIIWVVFTASIVKEPGSDSRFLIIAQINDVTHQKETAELLEKTDLRFKTATQNAGIGIWEYDLLTQNMYWDEVMYQLFDVDPKTNKTIPEIWNEQVITADADKVAQLMLNAIKNNEQLDYNYQLVTAKGEKRYLQVKGKLINNKKKGTQKLMGISFDVTEKTNLENTIAQNAALQAIILHLSLSFINVPLQKLDEQINYTLAEIGKFAESDRVYIFEYNFNAKTCSNTFEWCAPNVSPEIHNLQDVPLELIPEWVETHKRGEILYVPDVAALPEKSNLRAILEPQGIVTLVTLPLMINGSCFGFIGFDNVKTKHNWSEKEITLLNLLAELIANAEQRKQSQAALFIETNRLNGIIEATNVGTWEWNITTDETVYNYRWAEIIGYTLNELQPVNKNVWNKFVHPDDKEKSNIELERCFNKETDFYESEFRMKHKNGHWVWIRDKGKVIKWSEDGKPIIMMGAHTDITDKVKNEEKLLQTLQIVSDQNKRLLNFAHIISHNLRSHSANFITLLSLLEDEKDLEERKRIVQLLHDNAQNLEDSVINLNKVVKIQSDINKVKENIAVLPHVEQVIEEVKEKYSTVKLAIAVNIPSETTVVFNKEYFNNIIRSLVSNAVKFKHPNREPQINISLKKLAHSTIITVEDNGLGIDLEKHQHKIFGMYKTFHKHENARGLGLFIAKNQAEALGANIEVTSKPGEGSIFSLKIKNLY